MNPTEIHKYLDRCFWNHHDVSAGQTFWAWLIGLSSKKFEMARESSRPFSILGNILKEELDETNS